MYGILLPLGASHLRENIGNQIDEEKFRVSIQQWVKVWSLM